MPRPTLFDHPKFHRLAHLLGLPRPHVLGHLEFIWRVGYAAGNPVIGDEIDVELAAEWNGERGALVRALSDPCVQLLDVCKDGKYKIHDFFDHAPSYVKDRWRKELQRKKLSYHSSPRTVAGLSQDSRGTVPGQSRTNTSRRPRLSTTPTPTPTPTPSSTYGGTDPSGRKREIQPQPLQQQNAAAAATTPKAASSPKRDRPRYDCPSFAVFEWLHTDLLALLCLAEEADPSRAPWDLDEWYRDVSADLSRRGESVPRDQVADYLRERLRREAGLPTPHLSTRDDRVNPALFEAEVARLAAARARRRQDGRE